MYVYSLNLNIMIKICVMKKKKIKAGKKACALIITISVFAAITILHFWGAFQFLENKSYDMRVRITAPYLNKTDNIIVILINQDSIDWAQQ